MEDVKHKTYAEKKCCHWHNKIKKNNYKAEYIKLNLVQSILTKILLLVMHIFGLVIVKNITLQVLDASEILFLKSQTKLPIEISRAVLTWAPVIFDSLLPLTVYCLGIKDPLCSENKFQNVVCTHIYYKRPSKRQSDWIPLSSPNSWSSRKSRAAATQLQRIDRAAVV